VYVLVPALDSVTIIGEDDPVLLAPEVEVTVNDVAAFPLICGVNVTVTFNALAVAVPIIGASGIKGMRLFPTDPLLDTKPVFMLFVAIFLAQF
jgi:hypothetical protein